MSQHSSLPAQPVAGAHEDVDALARSLIEPDAFLRVFDLHFEAVHRYLHRRAGRDIADDLTAETFTQAFAARATFEPVADSTLPWLYGIATNLLRRKRRSEERRLRAYARSGRDEMVTLDVDALANRVDAAVNSRRLASALASLSPDDRDTLCLVALADLTQAQAAVALGVPVGTVASRLHRAKARLRDVIGDGMTTKERP